MILLDSRSFSSGDKPVNMHTSELGSLRFPARRGSAEASRPAAAALCAVAIISQGWNENVQGFDLLCAGAQPPSWASGEVVTSEGTTEGVKSPPSRRSGRESA